MERTPRIQNGDNPLPERVRGVLGDDTPVVAEDKGSNRFFFYNRQCLLFIVRGVT
jgi:hypothetical protein